MKKSIILSLLLFAAAIQSAAAVDISSLSWYSLCYGKAGDEWYGTDEAKAIADRVVHIQRENGGWMKNYETHLLTEAEVETIYGERFMESFLDNNSTTMEMQFLARVYSKTGTEAYRQSFLRGLQMIFDAQKENGGWSQTWPLRNNGLYHDYITFNDNLMTNVMRILLDTASDRGYFAGITDEETIRKCKESFDRAISLVIRCQVDDNGTPSAWCAQHHNVSLIPTEGRPFELPSISGYESFALLSFLMTLERPSETLQTTIRTAVAWLDAHRIHDKALEEYTNADGMPDNRIVDSPGSSLWARFIQLGGPTGEATYDEFFKRLRDRGKNRSYVWNGKRYTYSEYEIAKSSYKPKMAYMPLFSLYDDNKPHLFYRFLYNYEDTDPEANADGLPLETSLWREPRVNYRFMGNWGENVIDKEYPDWERRMLSLAESTGYDLYLLSRTTYIESLTEGSKVTYMFDGGITLSNNTNRLYAEGISKTNTIKYSRNTEYTIHLPEGMKVSRIRFTGYNNYANAVAYIQSCNGTTYSPTDYVFPVKDASGNPEIVSHIIDYIDNPATGDIKFTLADNQCALIITLYTPESESGVTAAEYTADSVDGECYDLQGRRVDPKAGLRPGVYIRKGGKFVVK